MRVSGSGKCSRKDFELRGLKFALLFNLYNRKLKPQLKHLKPRKTRPHDLPMLPRHSTHVDSQTSPMNWQMGISETPCSDTYVALPDILQTLLLHLVLHQNPILKKLVALLTHQKILAVQLSTYFPLVVLTLADLATRLSHSQESVSAV